eukprot:Selendium_serpulae@DN3845_c0_g1_i1.p1
MVKNASATDVQTLRIVLIFVVSTVFGCFSDSLIRWLCRVLLKRSHFSRRSRDNETISFVRCKSIFKLLFCRNSSRRVKDKQTNHDEPVDPLKQTDKQTNRQTTRQTAGKTSAYSQVSRTGSQMDKKRSKPSQSVSQSLTEVTGQSVTD